MAADPNVDAGVKKMLYAVLASWRNQFKDDPSKKMVASLYNDVKGGGNDRAYQAEQARLRKAEEERMAQRRHANEDHLSEIAIKKILEEDKKEEAKRMREYQVAKRAHLAMQESKAMEAERAKMKTSKVQSYSEMKNKGNSNAVRRAPFDLAKEKSNILLATATATQACHGLVNALQLVNREKDSVTTNDGVQESLTKVKDARKKVVRYIQLVENDPSGEFIGTLLSTNEQLIAALQLYDRFCKPAEQDSEDEAETGVSTAQLTSAADGNSAAIEAVAAKKPALVSRDTELDKLQDRQRAEVQRLNRARARQQTADSVHPDLADLRMDSSSSNLAQPIQPRHYGDDASLRSVRDDGLSDYSDYSSSDEEDYRRSRRSSGSHSRRASGSGNRGYAQYLDDDEKKKLGKKGGLLDDDDPSNDPFADPFADETPGVNEKQRMEWREV